MICEQIKILLSRLQISCNQGQQWGLRRNNPGQHTWGGQYFRASISGLTNRPMPLLQRTKRLVP